jgi:putative endonuclease
MKAIVYILHFNNSGKYYVGSTNNLERRLKQHRKGHTPSTKRLGSEFVLAFSQEIETLALARSVELRIKSWKRKDYIQRIISDGKIVFLENMGQ